VIIETIIITKVALALKGAVVIAAHNGLAVPLAQNFVSTAFSAGLVPALQGLAAALVGIGAMAGVALALESLLSALEDGDLDKIFGAIGHLATAVMELGD
jgi:hypothetical protein